jgi:predicted DNA-binding WGR domain protein
MATKKAAASKESYDEFRHRVLLICGKEADPPQEKKKDPGVVSEVTLYFTDPAKNSDKVYYLAVVREGTLYNVKFAYGRRGGKMTEGFLLDRPCTQMRAESELRAQQRKKEAKGYVESKDGGLKNR